MSDKKYKVLVIHPEVPEAGIKILEKGCEVIIAKSIPPNAKEVYEKAKGVDGILWCGHLPLNGEVLDAAGKNLKAISTMSAGLDYVDIPTLKARRIPLGYTPIVLNDAVADVAVGLMIAAARRFHEGRTQIVDGKWSPEHFQWMLGQDIKDATVGLLGFGGIGQTIAKRMKGFDVDLIYHCRKRNEDDVDYNAKYVTFNELLQQSDILFIAIPLTAETKGIINESAFNKMKKTSILINIARGDIVDQEALYNALKTNKIFAAGIDVMTPEPLPKKHKLLTLPNCIITPHIGSATTRTRENMAVIGAHNVINGIAGQPMLSPAYILPPES